LTLRIEKILIANFDFIELHKYAQEKTLINNWIENKLNNHDESSRSSSKVTKHINKIVGFPLVKDNRII
jgi:hypothetical protein